MYSENVTNILDIVPCLLFGLMNKVIYVCFVWVFVVNVVENCKCKNKICGCLILNLFQQYLFYHLCSRLEDFRTHGGSSSPGSNFLLGMSTISFAPRLRSICSISSCPYLAISRSYNLTDSIFSPHLLASLRGV